MLLTEYENNELHLKNLKRVAREIKNEKSIIEAEINGIQSMIDSASNTLENFRKDLAMYQVELVDLNKIKAGIKTPTDLQHKLVIKIKSTKRMITAFEMRIHGRLVVFDLKIPKDLEKCSTEELGNKIFLEELRKEGHKVRSINEHEHHVEYLGLKHQLEEYHLSFKKLEFDYQKICEEIRDFTNKINQNTSSEAA